MTTLLFEDAFPLSELPDRLPRRKGKKVHKSTVFRWAKGGCRGVVLMTVKYGGIRYTSDKDVERFFSELSKRSNGSTPKSRSVAERSRADADDELKRRGVA